MHEQKRDPSAGARRCRHPGFVGLGLGILALGLGGLVAAQAPNYFQQYPGGYTRAVYEIVTEGLEDPIRLGWTVEPASASDSDDRLRVVTTNEVIARRDQLETGVANGVAQAQLLLQDEAIQALLANRESLEPHTVFLLSGGARFVTGARETIGGVPAICGLLTDPEKPDRRTFLAIAEDPTVPFPPWMQLEEEKPSGGRPHTLSVCTSLALTALAPGRRFVEVFRLQLVEFERRE